MARLSGKAVQKITEIYTSLNCALYTSKITNMYSKLGGSYTKISMKESKHGNVVVMPLITNISLDGEQIRLISGILIRGPHHATDPNDKVNFVTTERIDVFEKFQWFWKPNKDIRTLVKNESSYFLVRQNAVRRNDSTYLTFTNNALVCVSNMIGEICLNKAASDVSQDPQVMVPVFIKVLQRMDC